MAALAAELRVNLEDEGARWKARARITEVLAPWFAARRVEDFARDFDAAGVTWSVFRSFAQALAEDPDLSTENPIFAELDQPGLGRYLVPGSPMGFSAVPREAPVRAPRLGEHTEQILADVAGLPGTEIASLFDAGIVAEPRSSRRLAS
jgi:2-methylfumaryl-CoA isomerase